MSYRNLPSFDKSFQEWSKDEGLTCTCPQTARFNPTVQNVEGHKFECPIDIGYRHWNESLRARYAAMPKREPAPASTTHRAEQG